MPEAPRAQLLYEGTIARRRDATKAVGFVAEAKRKEKLRRCASRGC